MATCNYSPSTISGLTDSSVINATGSYTYPYTDLTSTSVAIIDKVNSHYACLKHAVFSSYTDSTGTTNSLYKELEDSLDTLSTSSDLTDREVAEIKAKTLADMAVSLNSQILQSAIKIAESERDAPYAINKLQADTALAKQKAETESVLRDIELKVKSADVNKKIAETQLTTNQIDSEQRRACVYESQNELYEAQKDSFNNDDKVKAASEVIKAWTAVAAAEVQGIDDVKTKMNNAIAALEGIHGGVAPVA